MRKQVRLREARASHWRLALRPFRGGCESGSQHAVGYTRFAQFGYEKFVQVKFVVLLGFASWSLRQPGVSGRASTALRGCVDATAVRHQVPVVALFVLAQHLLRCSNCGAPVGPYVPGGAQEHSTSGYEPIAR